MEKNFWEKQMADSLLNIKEMTEKTGIKFDEQFKQKILTFVDSWFVEDFHKTEQLRKREIKSELDFGNDLLINFDVTKEIEKSSFAKKPKLKRSSTSLDLDNDLFVNFDVTKEIEKSPFAKKTKLDKSSTYLDLDNDLFVNFDVTKEIAKSPLAKKSKLGKSSKCETVTSQPKFHTANGSEIYIQPAKMLKYRQMLSEITSELENEE